MRKPNKSIRVFENPWLERLTHVHPITPLIVWGPVVAFLIWRVFSVHHMNPLSVLLIAVAGILSWTLAEYVLHRFLFHFEGTGPISQRMHFLLHGIHHADPTDATRLVMPPTASLFLAVIFFQLFSYLLGPIWAEPYFAFFVLGYLCYDYTHFAVHHFTPRTRVGKYLKHAHMVHHYVNPETNWGVSSPLWDVVFGTFETAKNKREAT